MSLFTSVPDNDRAFYVEWQRRAAWKRIAGQSKIDNAGIRCDDKPSCPCPICQEYGAMRQKAHSLHYLDKMDWPDAWRAAGWDDGSSVTPFAEPIAKGAVVIVTSNPAPRSWVSARFAEIDCLPSSNESACKPLEDVPLYAPVLKPEV